MSKECPKCNGQIVTDELTGEKFCNSCGFMGFIKSNQASSKSQSSQSEQTYAMQIRNKRKIRKGRCNKICHEYKATSMPYAKSRYESGLVKCRTCDIFLKREGCLDKKGNVPSPETVGLVCKCCGVQVRTRPKKSSYKESSIKRG